MRELSIHEMHAIAGGNLHPSNWLLFGGSSGALAGATYGAVSLFTNTPVHVIKALVVGGLIGTTLFGVVDILSEKGL